MINTNFYLLALNLPPDDPPGGQSLILGEVVGALAGCHRVFLPWPTRGLCMALIRAGLDYQPASSRWASRLRPNDSLEFEAAKEALAIPDECDAVYFGTPTIVAGKPLFPQDREWTKAGERNVAKALCYNAGKRLIVSGLGSGDISTEERLADMGAGALVAAYKKFRQPDGIDFEDWVLIRPKI